MTRFTEDFMEKIVNVSWAGGVWLMVWAQVDTGNNSVAPEGTATLHIGGLTVEVLANGIANPHRISAQDVAEDDFRIYEEFVQSVADPFVWNKQGVQFVNLNKLPSIFGPGVLIPGTVELVPTGTISSVAAVVAIIQQKNIVRKLINMKVNTSGLPLPADGSVKADAAFFPPNTATITFNADRKTFNVT